MIDFTKIDSKSKALLKEAKIQDFTKSIDLEKIIDHFNIALEKSDPGDDDISGAILRRPNKTTIYVNSSHSDERQRFTIAHELGHYVLHKNNDSFVDGKRTQLLLRSSNGEKSKMEVEANSFAASLLMPKSGLIENFDRLKRENKSDSEIIEELSSIYSVSMQAMGYRLTNLGLGI